MKNTTYTFLAVSTLACGIAPAAVLWSDNFDVADGGLDTASTAGRLSGTLAATTALQSFGAVQSISGNALSTANTGGVRFGPETDRFDWAAGATGTAIINAGGMRISYDWSPGTNTNGEWFSLNLGVPITDGGFVAGANTEYGILMRNAQSGGNFSQSFDNGTQIGADTTFTPTPSTFQTVVHLINFNSFADGTNVNIVTTIGGTEIANDNFQWGDAGTLRIDIGSNAAGHLIDNLTIETAPVPEPSSAALLGLGGLALILRRRK